MAVAWYGGGLSEGKGIGMIRSVVAPLIAAVCLSSGCESVAEPQAGGRNAMEVDHIQLTMKWCDISEERKAECVLEMTSLYLDRKAGLSYPKLQDNLAGEYRLKALDTPVGGKLMVAGEPYLFHFEVENIPTNVTSIRAVVTGFLAQAAGPKQRVVKDLVFTDIPTKPVVEVAAAPAGADGFGDTYWHGTIVPVAQVDENDIVKLWKRGAYIHLREDGVAGYNWSTPGPYIYDAANNWSEAGTSFTLVMSGAAYTFGSELDGPLQAYLEPGGAFLMTMAAKSKNEN